MVLNLKHYNFRKRTCTEEFLNYRHPLDYMNCPDKRDVLVSETNLYTSPNDRQRLEERGVLIERLHHTVVPFFELLVTYLLDPSVSRYTPVQVIHLCACV